MDLHQIRSDWTELGAPDPLWAVLVSPEHRHGRWDVDEFLTTGRDEVAATLMHAASLGLCPVRGTALDFGCGVGRLTIAMADHFDSVVGVDISPTMIAAARRLDTAKRCGFVENNRGDLSVFPDRSFELVYSSLVLQHLPARLACGYVAEMLRVLRPGGVLIVQLATSADNSVKGLLVRVLPLRAVRFAQQRLLGYPAPVDMYPMARRCWNRSSCAMGGASWTSSTMKCTAETGGTPDTTCQGMTADAEPRVAAGGTGWLPNGLLYRRPREPHCRPVPAAHCSLA